MTVLVLRKRCWCGLPGVGCAAGVLGGGVEPWLEGAGAARFGLRVGLGWGVRASSGGFSGLFWVGESLSGVGLDELESLILAQSERWRHA